MQRPILGALVILLVATSPTAAKPLVEDFAFENDKVQPTIESVEFIPPSTPVVHNTGTIESLNLTTVGSSISSTHFSLEHPVESEVVTPKITITTSEVFPATDSPSVEASDTAKILDRKRDTILLIVLIVCFGFVASGLLYVLSTTTTTKLNLLGETIEIRMEPRRVSRRTLLQEREALRRTLASE